MNEQLKDGPAERESSRERLCGDGAPEPRAAHWCSPSSAGRAPAAPDSAAAAPPAPPAPHRPRSRPRPALCRRRTRPSARAATASRSSTRAVGDAPHAGALHGHGPGERRREDRRDRAPRPADRNWTWAPTAHGTVASDGSFRPYWPANHIGQFAVRAVIENRAGLRSRRAPSPAVTTIVFRPSIATWYGDGSWGRRPRAASRCTATRSGRQPHAAVRHARRRLLPAAR